MDESAEHKADPSPLSAPRLQARGPPPRGAQPRDPGRIGTYSTVEHYTDGPAAKIIGSEQFSTATRIQCPVCSWEGTAGDGEIAFYTDLFDVSCPRCMKMLLVVGT